jgi:hypothetical protein
LILLLLSLPSLPDVPLPVLHRLRIFKR